MSSSRTNLAKEIQIVLKKYFVINDNNMEIIEQYNKDFLVNELVSLFTNPNIIVTAAGGIFTFKYGKYVVGKYTPTELIAAAHERPTSVVLLSQTTPTAIVDSISNCITELEIEGCTSLVRTINPIFDSV